MSGDSMTKREQLHWQLLQQQQHGSNNGSGGMTAVHPHDNERVKMRVSRRMSAGAHDCVGACMTELGCLRLSGGMYG